MTAYVPPDGVMGRGNKAEAEINDALAAVFKGKAGEAALTYLRSITLNNVQGPDATAEALRHLEGQRYLFAIIQQRVNDGRRKHPDPNEPDRPDPRHRRPAAKA